MKCLAAFAVLVVGTAEFALGVDNLLPQRIIYVGNARTPRAEAFETFLKTQFTDVTVADRNSFEPASATNADVVILDWSQDDSDSATAKSPLGPRDNWSTPTVLLGSAGHLLASPWQIMGGSG